MPKTVQTEAGRVLCSCGADVLRENWSNHRLRQDRRPHDPVAVVPDTDCRREIAEAAAAERDRHGGHTIPGFEAAYEAGRLDERERLRGEVEALPDQFYGPRFRASVLALLADKAARDE